MSSGIPPLDPFEGTFRDVSPLLKYTPYTPAWWVNSYIDRIPETAVGWLVAQGWQVIGTYEVDDVTYYQMTRQSMQSWKILQSLLEEFVQSYNEGRSANSIRYNDIIDLWTSAIKKVRTTLDTIADHSDEHVSLYFTYLDDVNRDIDQAIAYCQADVDETGDEVQDRLVAYLNELERLEGFHTTHSGLASGYLTGLGVTELARINESFDNQLEKARQELVNRGLYSSGLFAQYDARIERERNEAIVALNDRLNREKWENQHRLYDQQMANRLAYLNGLLQHADGTFKHGQWVVDQRRTLAVLAMQARLERIRGRMDVRDREEKLMAYQLDTHTNLAVGLFGFVERREDTYPSMESVTKLVAGLGDAGGGWVTPG